MKPRDTPKQSVKEKTDVFEGKVDEKKNKSKTQGQKLVEYGLTNPPAKRNHNDVGSPTSPEIKKSPKKTKAGDKGSKK